jgi:Fur family peroxide stress response transcriptional regulator
MPTLSKTTVYNTMKALVQAGIVKEIGIDEHETRYDISSEEHGHFKCESCNKVYDFSFNIDDGLKKGCLEGYQIYEKNVYLKGACPECLLDKKLANTD